MLYLVGRYCDLYFQFILAIDIFALVVRDFSVSMRPSETYISESFTYKITKISNRNRMDDGTNTVLTVHIVEVHYSNWYVI